MGNATRHRKEEITELRLSQKEGYFFVEGQNYYL